MASKTMTEQSNEAICVRAPTSPLTFDLQSIKVRCDVYLALMHTKWNTFSPGDGTKCRQGAGHERRSEVPCTERNELTIRADAVAVYSGVLLCSDDAIKKTNNDAQSTGDGGANNSALFRR